MTGLSWIRELDCRRPARTWRSSAVWRLWENWDIRFLLGTSPEIRNRTDPGPAGGPREEGTVVTTVYGVQKGCAFVRVHDVEKNRRAIQMTRALMRRHAV